MLAEDLENIKNENIIINDAINNSVMQHSSFYKIYYSNNNFSFSGLFFKFSLKYYKKTNEKIFFTLTEDTCNYNTIHRISNIENYLLNNTNKNIDKNINYKIRELLECENIKFLNNNINLKNFNVDDISNMHNDLDLCNNNISEFILKISGIWENKDSIGLTFKIIPINGSVEFNKN